MDRHDPLTIVTAWQAAANAQDVERLLELSDPNIEVVGPRGSGFGHQLLRDWLARAGLTLETLRAFVAGDTVVLEQRGVWRSPETGDVTGDKTLASLFRIENDRVVRVVRFARFDSIQDALAAGGLTAADQAS